MNKDVYKTKMAWPPGCEKFLKICLFVLTEFTNVTDGRTGRHTDGHRMTAKVARQKRTTNPPIAAALYRHSLLYPHSPGVATQ